MGGFPEAIHSEYAKAFVGPHRACSIRVDLRQVVPILRVCPGSSRGYVEEPLASWSWLTRYPYSMAAENTCMRGVPSSKVTKGESATSSFYV